MYMNTMRKGGSDSVVDVAGAPDAIDSSHGNAKAAPAPRSTDLREILLELIGHSPSDWSRTGSFDHHRTCAPGRGRRRRLDGDLASLTVAERNREHDFANQRPRAVV